jgi:pectate lyase-like protein
VTRETIATDPGGTTLTYGFLNDPVRAPIPLILKVEQLIRMTNEHAGALDDIESTLTGADLRDLYDVTAYGADVTGVADSTVATRNALAAAAANVTATGRRTVVYFPAGTFRFIMKTTQRHLDVNGMSKLVFLGAPGGRSRLKLAGSAGLGDWYLFNVRGGSSDIEFNRLVMDMDELTNPDPVKHNHLIQVGPSATDVRVIDCEFHDTVGDGIRQLGDFGVAVDGVMISRCRFINCGRSGVTFARWCRRTTLLGCYFENGDVRQIDFRPGGSALPFNPMDNHTTGSATTLTDPTASYQTWGIAVGDPIYNITHDTLCRVVSVDSQTSLTVMAGVTTWNDVLYSFPLHNSGHIIANNHFKRTTGPDILVTLSGSYGVTFCNNYLDGVIQAQDFLYGRIAGNQIQTRVTGASAPAIELIKATTQSEVVDNIVVCRNPIAAERAAISVRHQIRRPNSCIISRNQIRLETRGIGINVESIRHVTIQDNMIILDTPGDDVGKSGGITVRATIAVIEHVLVTGNDIKAAEAGGTFDYGIRVAASPNNVTQCVVGGGAIADCINPVVFSESTGVHSNPPVLVPGSIEDGSTPIVPPASKPWVLIGGVSGASAFTKSHKPGIYWGTGSPEGILAAGVGCLAMRRNATPALYVKTSGTETTGWTAVATV